jgi:hypothetical protein
MNDDVNRAAKAAPRAGFEREEPAKERVGVEIERLKAAGRNLGRQLEAQVRERPLVALGAAAGIGFVAGALVGSRLGQLAIALGIGYVAKNLVNGEPGGIERLVERGIEKLERAAG